MTDEERLFVGELLNSSTEIRQAVAVNKRFQEIVKIRNIGWLEKWLSEAEKMRDETKEFRVILNDC